MKILKECGFSFHFLTNCINEAIKNKKFRNSFKLSNIVPVHKKKDATGKTNYRPVSILRLLPKVLISLGILVRAYVCDEASPNRRFFKLMAAGSDDDFYWAWKPVQKVRI